MIIIASYEPVKNLESRSDAGLMAGAGALAAFIAHQDVQRCRYARSDAEKEYRLAIFQHPAEYLASIRSR